jgi:hypothetical protein
MGVAAEIENRYIQGRGAFLHSRVIKIENTMKEIKNTYERPRKMGAATTITIPKRNATTHVRPRSSQVSERDGIMFSFLIIESHFSST